MQFGNIDINTNGEAKPSPRVMKMDIDCSRLSYKSAVDNAIPEKGPAQEEDVIATSTPLKNSVKYIFLDVYLNLLGRGK